jgi:hypothetical protein
VRLEQEIVVKKGMASASLQSKLDSRRQRKMLHQIPPIVPDDPLSESAKIRPLSPPTVSLEVFIHMRKAEHKLSIHRLKSFLAHHRAELEVNCAHLSSGIIIEAMIIGLKKQNIYEIKALIATAKPAALVAEEHDKYIQDAARQMLRRYERDLKSIMDTLHNERMRDVRALRDKGMARSRIVEADQRRDVYDLDQLRREQGKLVYALAGLHLNRELLVPEGDTIKSPKQLLNILGSLDEDDDDDEELDGSATFKSALSIWRQWVMSLEEVYARSLPCLYSTIYSTHTKVRCSHNS